MEQVTKLAEFLNGKNAVFGNQIIKNDSDYYFDVLTELFRAYQRAGYVNKKPSDWLMPENHEKATKVLIMILHGLRALCKEVYHHDRLSKSTVRTWVVLGQEISHPSTIP